MNLNKILKGIVFTGLFLVPFVPFLITPSLLFPFITGKAFAFRIIVEIIFAAWLVLMLRDREFRPRFTWMGAALAVFTFIVFLADIFAVDQAKAFWSNFERMEGFFTLLHLFLFFVVASSTLHLSKYWNALLGTWVGASALMCIYGTMQLAGAIAINQGGVRVDGTLGNAGYLAVYLMFNIFFTAFLYLRSTNKKLHGWFLIPIGIYQLILLYFTATRGAILGLIGGIIIATIITAIFDREHKVIRKIAIGVLVSVIAFIGIFISLKDSEFVRQSPVLERFASLSLSEIQNQGRYFIWPMAIEGFKERPILGWGQEGFSYVFNKNYSPEMYAQEQWFDRAHSTPLDWLIVAGILGLLGYLSVIVLAYWYIWKGTDGGWSITEKSVLTGLLSAYVFQSIFVFDNLISYILLFTLLAMIHAMSGGKKMPISEWWHGRQGQSVVASLAVIFLILSMYFVVWKPLRVGQHLISALTEIGNFGPTSKAVDDFEKIFTANTFGNVEAREQLVSVSSAFLAPEVSPEVRDRFLALTQRELDKQISETPDSARPYIFRGIFYRNIGDYQKSFDDFEKALMLSPNKQSILFEKGFTHIRMGEYAEAQAVMKEAYDLAPMYTDAAVFYGISAIYNSNYTLANELFENVPDNIFFNDDRIIGAYADRNRWTDIIRILEFRIGSGADTLDNSISLAVAYLKSGSRQKSIDTLERLIGKSPEYASQIQYYIDEIKAGRDPSGQ